MPKIFNRWRLRGWEGPVKETELEQLEWQMEYQGCGIIHVKKKADLKNKKMIDEVRCN